MADHGKERFNDLANLVVVMMEFLQDFLTGLPVPIAIPDFVGGDQGEAQDAVLALDRARILIEDEPIGEVHQAAYKDLIIEWLTAYEMLVLYRIAGPAPWRLDCAENATSHFTSIVEMIENGVLDTIEGLDES